MAEPPASSAALAASVAALTRGAQASIAQCLDALSELVGAPPDDTWNRGLVLGCSHRDPAVREAAARACSERLQRLASQDEARDEFLDALLDFCLINQDQETIAVRAELLRAVTTILRDQPLHYEHHRTRLLIRSRDLQYRANQDQVTQQAVHLQKVFAEAGDRSDVQVVRRLLRWRTLQAYGDPAIAVDSLLAYLEQDRQLALDAIDPELLQAYRRLVATGAAPPRATLAALANLRRWLAAVPRAADQRQALARALDQAPVGGDPSTAALAQFHLSAHRALLAATEQAPDLIELLRAYAGRPEAAPLRAAALQVLALLPGARQRLAELGHTLRAALGQRQSPGFWRAALELAGQLVTGLSSAQPLLAGLPAGAETAAYARRVAQQLEGDQQLRGVLRELALGAAPASELRQRAWAILLGCQVWNHAEYRELCAQLLADPAHELYLTTLQVGRQQLDRALWPLVERSWAALIALGDDARRRERLMAVCALAQALRPLDMVSISDAAAPGLVQLAFDDPDAAVRLAASRALEQAGYGPLSAQESQRRAIGQLATRRQEATALIATLQQQIRQQAAAIEVALQAAAVAEVTARDQQAAVGRLNSAHDDQRGLFELRLGRLNARSALVAGQAQSQRTLLASFEPQITPLRARVSDLLQQLNVAYAGYQQLEADCAQLRARIERLSFELGLNPQGRGREARPDLDLLTRIQLEEQLVETMATFTTAEAVMAEAATTCNELRGRYDASLVPLERLQQGYAQAEQELAQTEGQYGQLATERQLLEGEWASAEQGYQQQLAGLRDQLARGQQQIDQLRQQAAELTGQRATAADQLQRTETDQQRLAAAIQQAEERRAALGQQARAAERAAGAAASAEGEALQQALQAEQLALVRYADALARAGE